MSDKFLETINAAIAPVTKAWKSYEVATITIDHDAGMSSGEDELLITVRLALHKEPQTWDDAMAQVHACGHTEAQHEYFLDGVLSLDMSKCPVKKRSKL